MTIARAANVASRTSRLQRTIRVWPIPPFRLDATVAVLRRSMQNPVDRWDGGRYLRVLDLSAGICSVTAEQRGSPERPDLEVTITPNHDDLVRPALRIIRLMLGIDVDLSGLYELAERDARLQRMVEPLRGIKPPRLASLFETLVGAVACQQLSITAGMAILGRLADRFGRRPPAGDTASFAFPRPQELAEASEDELRALGFSRTKARTLQGLSRAIVDRTLDLESLAKEPNATVLARLQALPGIGPWSAEYALLRGLGRLDVFPIGDVGAANALAQRLHLRSTPAPARVREITAPWGQWRGAVYLHLLGLRLIDLGHLAPSSPARVDHTH